MFRTRDYFYNLTQKPSNIGIKCMKSFIIYQFWFHLINCPRNGHSGAGARGALHGQEHVRIETPVVCMSTFMKSFQELVVINVEFIWRLVSGMATPKRGSRMALHGHKHILKKFQQYACQHSWNPFKNWFHEYYVHFAGVSIRTLLWPCRAPREPAPERPFQGKVVK